MVVKNLILSYNKASLPDLPDFDFRNLTVKSSDNFTYSFVTYHAIMSEIKIPVSQDPKIRLFLNILLKTRNQIAQLTARLTEDYHVNLSSSTYPLQHNLGGEIFHWTKDEPFEIFYHRFLKSKITSLCLDLGPMSIASRVIMEPGLSPFQNDQNTDLFESFATMPSKNLPTFRDWN